jgi:hypothetical protein
MNSIDENNKLADKLAILAPTLYLLNLLLLPGLAFLILIFIFIKCRHIQQPYARIQIQQNFYASIASGLAIVGISIVIILIGGFSSVYSWMVMLIYALSIHATLVLLGAFSLARAINQQAYLYPGLSRFSEDNV